MGDDDIVTTVIVHKVTVPAMSTIGYGEGVDHQNGDVIQFVGDHGPMRNLVEALRRGDAPVVADVHPHNITRRSQPGQA